MQTYGVGVCRGGYAPALVREWRAWDKRNGSENDPVDVFGPEQLFVVFVVADGGADLEHFEVHNYEEARSILLQVRKISLLGCSLRPCAALRPWLARCSRLRRTLISSCPLQTVLALAVAEEAVQFEHRDLHWGNLLIRRVPAGKRIACTLRWPPQ